MRALLARIGGLATALALAASLGLGAAACQKAERGPAPVDDETMAFLSEARALHHEANMKEDAGDLPGAIGAIDRLVAARRPHPERPTPEVDEVLADAYARLGELRLKQGDLDGAGEAADKGLSLAPQPTYFKGHLVEVEGLVEESRAAKLTDAGKPEEAKAARERAIARMEEVVKIQDQVIQRSLSGKDGGAQ